MSKVIKKTEDAVKTAVAAVKQKKQSGKKAQAEKKEPHAPNKLYTLVLVVPDKRADYYVHLLSDYEVNVSYILQGEGTSQLTAKGNGYLIGDYIDHRKAVIISAVKDERVKEILNVLNEKFDTVKNGSGIAFTIPFSSMIGLLSYRFLSNIRK